MNKKVVQKAEYLRKLFPNMTKVYGNTSGLSYYYINMYVGIPPTRQSLNSPRLLKPAFFTNSSI